MPEPKEAVLDSTNVTANTELVQDGADQSEEKRAVLPNSDLCDCEEGGGVIPDERKDQLHSSPEEVKKPGKDDVGRSQKRIDSSPRLASLTQHFCHYFEVFFHC